MIDKRFLKKFTLEDCTQCRIELSESLKLTKERLGRLKRKQKENPAWVAYCKYADAFVGIDIRIEEQLAVREEIEQNIVLVDARARELKAIPAEITVEDNVNPQITKAEKRLCHRCQEKIISSVGDGFAGCKYKLSPICRDDSDCPYWKKNNE